MSSEEVTETTRDLKVKLCKAGKKAIKELITVAQASIFNSQDDDGIVSNDDVAAEKMKAAAQAKKVAIMDAFDIADKIDKEEAKMEAEDNEAKNTTDTPIVKEETKKTDFNGPEKRA